MMVLSANAAAMCSGVSPSQSRARRLAPWLIRISATARSFHDAAACSAVEP